MSEPDQVHLIAQRLAAMAQTGLAYAKDRYDVERYGELRDLAARLMTLPCPDQAPVLLESLSSQEGYATPKVDVRAVVIRDGRILLAREEEDGLWSLPGGWADVGDRPSGAVEREVREETGLEVEAVRLLAVWDRSLHTDVPHQFAIYKLFFLCEERGGELNPTDSLGADFFSPTDLPPLSLGRVVPSQISACLSLAAHPSLPACFD